MEWREMNEAIMDARRTINWADMVKHQMASLFAGQLQASQIGNSTLCRLKRELRNYNMNTGKWKD